MNQTKFMQTPVDEEIHLEAHTAKGAEIIVNQMRQNWVHLTYSWGFAPEIEQQDWESFRQATQTYHAYDVDVFAYIQTSNCVFEGSNKQKHWYAMDPAGKKFYYYTNRYMTCLQNEEWIQFLKDRIRGAIERNADGIFFDNLWYGTQPSGFGGSWLGSAGCYCEQCQERYHQTSGKRIPTIIDPSDADAAGYLEWRSTQMTALFKSLANYARELKEDIIISANDYDAVMRPSKLIFGIDFSAFAEIQDLMMIENFCLPNWEPGSKTRFPNNAMTIRTARSLLTEDKHLSILSYDAGIGFDDVYPTRRILQGMAEITALGASVTSKGTEYFDGKQMTLITAPGYTKQRAAIGNFNQWLEDHAGLFRDRTNVATLALLHPGEPLWKNWFQTAPIFFGCMQTLTRAGIPWKVVTSLETPKGIQTLLTFSEKDRQAASSINGLFVINVFDLEGWQMPQPSFLSKHRLIQKVTSTIIEGLIHSYHARPLTRKAMDQLGMAKMVTQTPLFFMPDKEKQKRLMDSIPNSVFPKITCNEPVLHEIWQLADGRKQIHLVNYGNMSQPVEINFESKISGEITQLFHPGFEEFKDTDLIRIDLNIYAIIQMKM
jgi:hypothetical protein